jgi:hypothetical protein
LEKLQLTFATSPTEDLQLKIEIEIQNAADTFAWEGSTSLFRTSNIKALLQEKSVPEGVSNEAEVLEDGTKAEATENSSATYLADFSGVLYKRSSYISLSKDTMCLLANAKVNVKCSLVREPSTIVPEAPTKKGAPPPQAVLTLEEKITEMNIPLSSLLVARGNAIAGTFPFDSDLLDTNATQFEIKVESATAGLGAQLLGSQSFLTFKMAADNDLAVSLRSLQNILRRVLQERSS